MLFFYGSREGRNGLHSQQMLKVFSVSHLIHDQNNQICPHCPLAASCAPTKSVTINMDIFIESLWLYFYWKSNVTGHKSSVHLWRGNMVLLASSSHLHSSFIKQVFFGCLCPFGCVGQSWQSMNGSHIYQPLVAPCRSAFTLTKWEYAWVSWG